MVTEMRSDEEILAELRRASAGLTVMSESDYPFEMVRWESTVSLTPAYLRDISGKTAESAIEEIEVDEFFGTDGRFRSIARCLKENLYELRVYKVGTINIPVFIVGRSPAGNWLGLSTRLVQT
jgi:hypothetical protein